jgi:two-component system, OmpR family, response regulator MprA
MTQDTSSSAWLDAHPRGRPPVSPISSLRPLTLDRPIQRAAERDAPNRTDAIERRGYVTSVVPDLPLALAEHRVVPVFGAPSPGLAVSEGLLRAPRAATPATLLVVDDDENLLRMLRRGLAFTGYTVRMAADGETALRAALEAEPDLIVLDVMLPEPLDGLEVARRLRAGGSNVPILMLTAREQLADKMAGFASGADDYLPKPFAFEELLARVAALLRRSPRGNSAATDEVLEYADLSLNSTTREVWRGGEPIELTAREFDVLAYFLRHPRQVLSRDQLFRGVWGSDFLGGSNVVDSCVSCIRQKLEAGGRARLLQTVRSVGYSLRA